jgi:Fur family transcriptional regulator, ferric uptake regulator
VTAPRKRAVSRAETWQQKAVADVLHASVAALSANDLYACLRREGRPVSRSTVYRALRHLVEVGVVETVRIDGSATGFRCCGPQPHGHLICRSCRWVIDVDYAEVQNWALRLAREFNFSDVEVATQLWGRCPQCQIRDEATRGQGLDGRPVLT